MKSVLDSVKQYLRKNPDVFCMSIVCVVYLLVFTGIVVVVVLITQGMPPQGLSK